MYVSYVSFTPNYVTYGGVCTLYSCLQEVTGRGLHHVPNIVYLAVVDSIPVSSTLKLWTPHMVQDAQLNKVDDSCFCSLFYRLRNLQCMEFSDGSRSVNFPNPIHFLSTVLRQTKRSAHCLVRFAPVWSMVTANSFGKEFFFCSHFIAENLALSIWTAENCIECLLVLSTPQKVGMCR